MQAHLLSTAPQVEGAKLAPRSSRSTAFHAFAAASLLVCIVFIGQIVWPAAQSTSSSQAFSLQRSDLEDATLGASGHLAIPNSQGTLQTGYSRPRVTSGSAAAFQLRGLRGPGAQRSCGIFCAAHRGDEKFLLSEEEPLGRRQTGLAASLLTLAAALMPQAPALAAKEAKPVDFGFSQGPEGIKYFDLDEGDGKEAVAGQKCKVTYLLEVAPTKLRIEENPGYKFEVGSGQMPPVNTGGIAEKERIAKDKRGKYEGRGFDLAVLGGAGMPPMKVGGTRQVLIPAELGYGKEGIKCNASSNCPGGYSIPPDTLIKFTIALNSAQNPS
eukprot:gnl/TRDRNA2_/TRDRNA2_156601_c0_seq2.p1 gnl/TRDRNA2_/TRDRNA2_156601_c0~~gnl/TRDRNA2_/TRDRNA2_156601_c0_seq2.p1  ORF type:complete len:326 (+),score=54.54 gnl/TRDRNA2_/TRDRNA2_156601_c0_seq2:54-1031(+)